MATQTGTSGTSGQTRAGAGGGQSGQGTSDVTYNLISVMYHALQGCETYEKYAQDAEQQGNRDLAQFFREALQEDQQRAQRGQQLLMQCLQSEQGGRGQMLQGGAGAQGQQSGSGAAQQSTGGQGQQGSSGSQGRGGR